MELKNRGGKQMRKQTNADFGFRIAEYKKKMLDNEYRSVGVKEYWSDVKYKN